MIWKYIVMRPFESEREGTVNMSREPTMAELGTSLLPLIGAESFEHVIALYRDKRRDMFVDALAHRKQLPLNTKATFLSRAATIARNPDVNPRSLPVVVGPAVLFTLRVWK